MTKCPWLQSLSGLIAHLYGTLVQLVSCSINNMASVASKRAHGPAAAHARQPKRRWASTSVAATVYEVQRYGLIHHRIEATGLSDLNTQSPSERCDGD